MYKLYIKSEIWFAVAAIIAYVVGTSAADGMSEVLGYPKTVTALFHLAFSAVLIIWMKKHSLLGDYGMCKGRVKASRYLFYLPLVLISSCNLWFGVNMNMPPLDGAFYVLSMLCVGFLEEVIFRGFLFRAMAKDNVRLAVIVSSLTFGFGHIVNLFNSSGAGTLSTVCQICYAAAFGFLFVTVFYRGGSLIPCVVTHSVINSMSVFAADIPSARAEITVSVILCLTAVTYTAVLCRTLPLPKKIN